MKNAIRLVLIFSDFHMQYMYWIVNTYVQYSSACRRLQLDLAIFLDEPS